MEGVVGRYACARRAWWGLTCAQLGRHARGMPVALGVAQEEIMERHLYEKLKCTESSGPCRVDRTPADGRMVRGHPSPTNSRAQAAGMEHTPDPANASDVRGHWRHWCTAHGRKSESRQLIRLSRLQWIRLTTVRAAI